MSIRFYASLLFLFLCFAPKTNAQEVEEETPTEPPSESVEPAFITPGLHPSQEGSAGVYHVRSAYTFDNPGAAFEGNDHFFGSNNYYQPDNRSVRATVTRDCLTVNLTEGIDFSAVSIFRSLKVALDDKVGQPAGVLATPLPSILMATKFAWIDPGRRYAFAVEPFWELRAVPHDFAIDLQGSPLGARFLASRDFRYDKGLPLKLHINLGYRFDRSSGLLDRAKAAPHNFGPANIPEDPDLSTEELYALGVPRTPMEAAFGLFRTDQILVGFAAEAPTEWVTPFLEYSGEIVLGGLPFASSPQRVTLGGRFTPRPDKGDLSIDLAIDFRLSRKGQLPAAEDGTLTEVQVEPGVAYTVGVGWVFGHRFIREPVRKTEDKTKPSSTNSENLETPETVAPLTPPLNATLAPFGDFALWIPENSALYCTGKSIFLCSIKTKNASKTLSLRASQKGAKSFFANLGPSGTPLLKNEAKTLRLAKQDLYEWKGKNASGFFRVLLFTSGNIEYEISYEGATKEETKQFDQVISSLHSTQ